MEVQRFLRGDSAWNGDDEIVDDDTHWRLFQPLPFGPLVAQCDDGASSLVSIDINCNDWQPVRHLKRDPFEVIRRQMPYQLLCGDCFSHISRSPMGYL
jgi:hypothetical protein